MEQEKEILNQSELSSRAKEQKGEVLEIPEETAEKREEASGEKTEIELFSEEMKAENRAFDQTIALVASLRKEKITEAKEKKQTILATAENLPDAHQLKEEYDAVLHDIENQLVYIEKFKPEALIRLISLKDIDIASEGDIKRLNYLLRELGVL